MLNESIVLENIAQEHEIQENIFEDSIDAL